MVVGSNNIELHPSRAVGYCSTPTASSFFLGSTNCFLLARGAPSFLAVTTSEKRKSWPTIVGTTRPRPGVMDPERAALVGAPPGQADRRRAGTKNYPNLAVALVTLVSATLMVIANRNTLALPTLGAAPHGERPHRQTVMSWSSTHKQRAHSQLSPGTPGFPMVRQLVRHGEEGALQIVQRNWDSYHRNGANALTPLYLPDVTLWPEGGGYEELTSVIARDNGLIEGTTIGYLKMVPRKEEAAYDASSAGDVLASISQ